MKGRARVFRVWPGAIFVLLGMNFAVVGVTVYLSNKTRVPVESGYDHKALHWDDEQQQRMMNRSLGWRVEARLVRTESKTPAGTTTVISGVRGPHKPVHSTLQVTLTDAAGKPIKGAGIAIEAFSIEGGSPIRLTLERREDGTFAAPFAVDAPSHWVVRFDVRASQCRFTDELRFDVGDPTAGEILATRGGER